MRQVYTLVVLVAAATGCSGERNSTAGATVVAPVAAGLARAVLDSTVPRIWSFGGLKDDPDDEIRMGDGVMRLVPLSGGRYLLTEGDRLRVFDSAGEEQWRFGRAGAGPQEFSLLAFACALSGDTVAMLDQANSRVATVVPGEGVVATTPAVEFRFGPTACTPEGWFVTTRTDRDSSGAETVVVQRRSSTGALLGEIARVPQRGQPTPLGYSTPTIGAVGNEVYIADPNEGTITFIDRDGRLLRELVIEVDRLPVNDASLPLRGNWYPVNPTEEAVAAWRARWVDGREKMPEWPAFQEIRGDDSGRLWVRLHDDVANRDESWFAIGQSGEVLDRVSRSWVMDFIGAGIVLWGDDADGARVLGVVPAGAR